MSLLQRLLPVAVWDALRSSPDRAYTVHPIQDAHKDLSQHERLQLISLVRDLERNDPFVNRVLDLHDLYVFGASGLRIKAASTDEEWNEVADEVYEDWCQHPAIGMPLEFGDLQKVIGGSWGTDGGVHAILTEVPAGRFVRPRIQLIEAHRCTTPSTLSPDQRLRVHDGVEVDPLTMAPLAYYYSYKDGHETKWKRIAAESVVYIHDPRRIHQLHSPPIFYPVINDIQDMREWQNLVKVKLKDTAETSKVLYTKSGSKNLDNLRNRFVPDQQSNSHAQTIDEKVGVLRKVLGARTVNLESGDDYKEFRSDQPADSSQRFWEIIARKACAGINIPYEVVFPTSIQGTMARATFDMAHAQFNALQSMFGGHFKRIREHVLRVESRSNRRLADFPRDWRQVHIIGPRAINVDIGYASRAAIAEVEAGLRTYEEIYEPKAMDYRYAFRQLAKAKAYAKQQELENGLSEGSLLGGEPEMHPDAQESQEAGQ